MSAASSNHSGCSSRMRAPPRRGVVGARARGCARRARTAGPGSSRAGAGRPGGAAPSLRARAAHVRARRSPRGSARPGRCRAPAPRGASASRPGPSGCGSSPNDAEPLEQAAPGSRAIGDRERGFEADGERERGRWLRRPDRRRRRRPRASRPRASARSASSLGLRSALELLQPPAQQRRRQQRGDQHDEQQRRVEVVAEHALVEPDRREDQPDLAAREHAQADERLVAGCSDRTGGREQLADDRDDRAARPRSRAPRPARTSRRRPRCRSPGRRPG